jgi:Rad3-related DNA helicase
VFAHLRDKIDCCAALFGRGRFELAPPFLPSLALDVFERPIRRVYLSATLRSRSDFVRAFGRLPEMTIEPDNDAGNGERLILFGRMIPGDITPKLVASVSQTRKTLIAVPNYPAAKAWADLAEPPDPEDFSGELDKFRASDTGAFVLVSRVDGIDLRHDTCRVMVLDGLPSGTSLIERYQWEFLRMGNLHATRLANRLVQLFGRINRGRNDYGVSSSQEPN